MIPVRRATADDVTELVRLRGVMLGRFPEGPWRDNAASVIRAGLGAAQPRTAAFVVDRPDDTGLAACVLAEIDQRLPNPGNPSGRRGHVYNVATDPAYRRRGFSRACLTAALQWFGERDVRVVDLRASPDGEPLYASLGFTRTSDPAMRLRLNP